MMIVLALCLMVGVTIMITLLVVSVMLIMAHLFTVLILLVSGDLVLVVMAMRVKLMVCVARPMPVFVMHLPDAFRGGNDEVVEDRLGRCKLTNDAVGGVIVSVVRTNKAMASREGFANF